MEKTVLDNRDIHERAIAVALNITKDLGTSLADNESIKIYGVPRGGIAAAYAVAKYLPSSLLVDRPEQAHVIIDDITDSGKTRLYFERCFPAAKFYALVGKNDPDDWYVFPWEVSLKGNDESADDIPVRLLEYIGEDPSRGGLLETPKRFLKAWEFYSSGYSEDPKSVLKVFEDGAEDYDEMVLVKDIPVYSHCEHHLAPFFGVAHVAYIPNGKIVGLSKLSRLVDIYSHRLQVQERLTSQIATALWDCLEPKGSAVILECRHMCMESRGIQRQGSATITSSMKGVFMEQGKARSEMLALMK